MNNYLEQNEIGIINGIKVQCLPLEKGINWNEVEGNACYNCFFDGKFLGCEIPCCDYERPDKTSVYFKKVE